VRKPIYEPVDIACAMLKDAPIILLDEATAALDLENEIYIQQAIQELVKENCGCHHP
jgi:ATP-binding cassette subfamily B protein